MKQQKWIGRYALLCVGLMIMAFGVAFSICADLGTSPISSLPYVVSEIAPITVGQATIAMHVVFVLLQILILRKRYEPIQLLQLVVAIVFGYMTDLAVWATNGITYHAYWQQVILCVAGIILVGVGVALEVTAGVITVAGEGLVLAVTKVSKIKFGNMKIIFDCTLVAIACILSFVFLHGIYGVREGTLAAAIFVGMTSKAILAPIQKWKVRKMAAERSNKRE